MGQHLHIYASKDLPLTAAKVWCAVRSTDIIRCPTVDEQKWLDSYAEELDDADEYEDGPCRCHLFDFLVWEAYVVDDELVRRVEAVCPEGAEFLRQRIGWIAWGDNDGV